MTEKGNRMEEDDESMTRTSFFHIRIRSAEKEK